MRDKVSRLHFSCVTGLLMALLALRMASGLPLTRPARSRFRDRAPATGPLAPGSHPEAAAQPEFLLGSPRWDSGNGTQSPSLHPPSLLFSSNLCFHRLPTHRCLPGRGSRWRPRWMGERRCSLCLHTRASRTLGWAGGSTSTRKTAASWPGFGRFESF